MKKTIHKHLHGVLTVVFIVLVAVTRFRDCPGGQLSLDEIGAGIGMWQYDFTVFNTSSRVSDPDAKFLSFYVFWMWKRQ